MRDEEKGRAEVRPCPPSRDGHFKLLIEQNRLCAPVELHPSDLVVVGLNFRVGSLVRELRPTAWNCSYNFAIMYELELGLAFFRSQIIVTRLNLSTTDCHGLAWFP